MGIKWRMYTRIVDDINMVVNRIPQNNRYDKKEDKMEIKEDNIDTENISTDKNTFNAIRDIGSSIFPNIELTSDVPSNHKNGYCPMLDVQTKMVKNKIAHKYYEKPMS